MNKQIRQLAEQAGMGETELGVGKIHQFYGDGLERFAKLIVRECVEVCEALKDDDGFDANFARTTCANEIRQHFGVEQ
jgi:hypothetical protein